MQTGVVDIAEAVPRVELSNNVVVVAGVKRAFEGRQLEWRRRGGGLVLSHIKEVG